MFEITLATELQLVTFILEILGVTLAFIEIWFPDRADRIERRIRMGEDAVRNLGERITNNRLTEYTMTAFTFVIFLSLFDVWGLIDWPTFVWIIFGIIFAVVGTVFGLYLVQETIRFLNHNSNGRALGALGVLLAIFGLIGEVGQIYLTIITD
jgi:hypothetical protein